MENLIMKNFLKQLFCFHEWKLIKYYPIGVLGNVPIKHIKCKRCNKEKKYFEPFDQNYYNV